MARVEQDVVTKLRDTTVKSRGKLVDMNWDPITRIVGSLGI